MRDFVVLRMGPQWVVVNDGVVFSRHGMQAVAAAAAIEVATRTPLAHGPNRVVVEHKDGRREVIWNSDESRASATAEPNTHQGKTGTAESRFWFSFCEGGSASA